MYFCWRRGRIGAPGCRHRHDHLMRLLRAEVLATTGRGEEAVEHLARLLDKFNQDMRDWGIVRCTCLGMACPLGSCEHVFARQVHSRGYQATITDVARPA